MDVQQHGHAAGGRVSHVLDLVAQVLLDLLRLLDVVPSLARVIDLIGAEGSFHRRRVSQERDELPVQVGLALDEVVRVPHHFFVGVLLVRLVHEGPGPDGRGVLQGLLVEHLGRDGKAVHVVEEEGARAKHLELERHIVDGGDALEVFAALDEGAARCRRYLQEIDDLDVVISDGDAAVGRGAVVVLDPRDELHGDLGVTDDLPGLGPAAKALLCGIRDLACGPEVIVVARNPAPGIDVGRVCAGVERAEVGRQGDGHLIPAPARLWRSLVVRVSPAAAGAGATAAPSAAACQACGSGSKANRCRAHKGAPPAQPLPAEAAPIATGLRHSNLLEFELGG